MPAPLSPPRGSSSPNARALDELPAPGLRDELVVLDDHLAADEHDLRSAGDLGALEQVVVHVRVVGRGRDRQLLLGIPDDDVGVASPARSCPCAGRGRSSFAAFVETSSTKRFSEIRPVAHAEARAACAAGSRSRARRSGSSGSRSPLTPFCSGQLNGQWSVETTESTSVRERLPEALLVAPSAAAAACRRTSRPRSRAGRAPISSMNRYWVQVSPQTSQPFSRASAIGSIDSLQETWTT